MPTGSGASAPGSRSCGPRASARTARARRPIACLGPVDQHSQLQLFMDGPHEHLITRGARARLPGSGPRIDRRARRRGRARLPRRPHGRRPGGGAGRGRARGAGAGRPARCAPSISPALTSGRSGALMMHMMLETILAARLLGVDPFDQPAVELAKVITRERVAALK